MGLVQSHRLIPVLGKSGENLWKIKNNNIMNYYHMNVLMIFFTACCEQKTRTIELFEVGPARRFVNRQISASAYVKEMDVK